jgi:short-subunit dehydrogenase
MKGAFAGKVVLVTGASSGIGAELARQFAAAGARVALVARNLDRLNEVADECRAAGGQAFVASAELTDENACREMVRATVAHYGALDILVNNAGVRFHGRFDEITDLSVFETIMRVNFLASVWSTAYALPHLKKSRGQIVVMSSLQGLVGVPNRSAYSASKHAMTGFFDSLRVEIKEFGVSVTTIHPSFVYSEHHSRVLAPDGTPMGDRAYKRPASDAMSAEECCRLTLKAVERRDRMVLMTWRGKVGRILKLIWPAMIDRMAKAATEKKK